MSTITVPLGKLHVSPLNVRTNEEDTANTGPLEASILAHGLLEPLAVHPLAKPKGAYGVFAGGRRLRAMQRLALRGDLPCDHPVDVTVRPMEEGEIREASIAENLLRRNLRPYEVYAAFAVHAAHGATADQIAHRFGQSIKWVRQTLRLGSVAPAIFDAYVAGDLSDDQVQAYAATEDQDLQVAVWQSLSKKPRYDQGSHAIRKALNVGDARLQQLLAYVGLDDYRDAGGRFEEDLFAREEGSGRVIDDALLHKLVAERIEEEKAEVTRLTGRDLTFVDEPPKTTGAYGYTDSELEIQPRRKPLIAADRDRLNEIQDSKAGLEGSIKLLMGADGAPAAGAEDEVAELRQRARELGDEAQRIEAGRGIILPKAADIVAVIRITHGSRADVTFWHASRKAMKAAAKTGDTGRPDDGAGGALNDLASPGLRKTADDLARGAFGLSKDGVQVMRSIRRQSLRAMLVEDARAGGTVGHDYLVFAAIRDMLVNTDRNGLGFVGLREQDHGAPAADPHLAETRSTGIYEAACAELREQSFITAKNVGGAFMDFQAAPAEIRNLAAAVVAARSLTRSMNADGYRVDVHDVLANATKRSFPSAIRRIWQPTAAFLELLPKANRLAIVEPMIAAGDFKTWRTGKAAEITSWVLKVLTGAKRATPKGTQAAQDWVHPCLTFERPNVCEPDERPAHDGPDDVRDPARPDPYDDELDTVGYAEDLQEAAE